MSTQPVTYVKKPFGTLSDGREVSLIEIRSSALTVCITDYGARIVSVMVKGIDVVHGPKTLEGFLADKAYCGALCGRVANRIAGGHFTLDGEDYTLAINNGPNHLHGGVQGFDSKLWTIESIDADEGLRLSYFSPDGEEGYPGDLQVYATYTVDKNVLSLDMEIETHEQMTIANLTNHVYWNLTGEGTMNDHELMVEASAYTPVNDTLIPDGSILPVAGTPYDLRTPSVIGERAYDTNFVLPTDLSLRLGEELATMLYAPKTGIRLKLTTDLPGLQVYTGDYLPESRGGIALEAQLFPDAIHHPHFPTPILSDDDTSSHFIEWHFEA